MAKQVGALIKEARNNSGLSQVALAEKVGCVTATDISKAEREIKEFSPEQLIAVAEALGVTPESLTDAPPVLTADEIELLKLYRSSDDAAKQAALSALKGEAPQNANPMAAMMSMFSGMMGGGGAEGGENPMAAMMGGGAEGGGNPMAAMMGGGAEGGGNPMAAMMSMFSGMMGGGNAQEAPKEDPKE